MRIRWLIEWLSEKLRTYQKSKPDPQRKYRVIYKHSENYSSRIVSQPVSKNLAKSLFGIHHKDAVEIVKIKKRRSLK